MGPRPDGRGRRDLAVRRLGLGVLASMGPRPDGRGRSRTSCLPRSRRCASMGPRPDGRGRRRPVLTYKPEKDGVNGAAAGWPRKAERPRQIAEVVMRQWGRGRMAAEGNSFTFRFEEAGSVNGAAAGWPRKGRGRRERRPPRRASMGPRPDGRGRCGHPCRPSRGRPRVNGAAAGWPRKVGLPSPPAHTHPASMGPRPDGRGRSCSPARASRPPRSVNGAAAGWPRKARHNLVNARIEEGRQWGRGRMAAEGLRPTPPPPPAPRRQWGRGRMAAEGVVPPDHVACLIGVNGAAAGWPRKACPCWYSSSCGRGRQWGRGRMAAEGAIYLQNQGWGLWASMGPRPDGRGRHMNIMMCSAFSRRQWGRGRMAAEGGASRPSPACGRSSVNGAAAGWPRKDPP